MSGPLGDIYTITLFLSQRAWSCLLEQHTGQAMLKLCIKLKALQTEKHFCLAFILCASVLRGQSGQLTVYFSLMLMEYLLCDNHSKQYITGHIWVIPVLQCIFYPQEYLFMVAAKCLF